MNIKKSTLLAMALLVFVRVDAQVNLAKGTLNISLPMMTFKDPLSKLSLNVGLQYNSGNGLRVNEVAGAAGTGWNIEGISFVTRVVKGVPDDQTGRGGDMQDTTQFPSGYQYTGLVVEKGCPRSLTTYPLFEQQNVPYQDHYNTTADRQLDYFYFSLNGRNGAFVVGQNRQAICLNDSRIKISVELNPFSNDDKTRTSIKVITITDENGILFEFGQRENTKLYNYKETPNYYFVDYLQQICKLSFNERSEIPIQQLPYITNTWYITAMKDEKAGRVIRFTYNTVMYDIASGKTVRFDDTPLIVLEGQDPGNARHALNVTDQQSTVLHPEIKHIKLADGSAVEFTYGHSRKDLPGTAALTKVVAKNSEGSILNSYQLNYKYFVKNEIKDPVAGEENWARLCLQSTQKSGVGILDTEPPTLFDYYTGTDAVENFVPPAYFHAQDPWGYYNGSYSGLPLNRFLTLSLQDRDDFIRMARYNMTTTSQAPTITANAKTGYAQNGLLKSVTNQYGGVTQYEYAQNTVAGSGIVSIDNGVVGGVHLSKVIQKGAAADPDIVTEYRYIDENGTSSLWGVEAPENRAVMENYYEPAQKNYVPGFGCNYKYKFSGKKPSSNWDNSSTNCAVVIQKLTNAYGKVKQAYELLKQLSNMSFTVTSVLMIALSDFVSCSQNPVVRSVTTSRSNIIFNYANTLPMLFRQVEEKTYSSNGMNAGHTVHYFTSDTDYPLLVPVNNYPYVAKQRYFEWAYGLPKKRIQYNNSNQMVAISENNYTLVQRTLTDANTLSCNCIPQYMASMRSDSWQDFDNVYSYTNTTIPGRLSVEMYNINTGRMELTNSKQTLFDANGNPSQTETNYTYNAQNYLPSVVSTVDSKGQLLQSKTYYLEDYDLSLPAHHIFYDMKNDNIVNVPVSTETWQTKPNGSPELLATSVIEYGTAPNGDFRPIKTYTLQTDAPVPLGQIGPFNPQQLIRGNDLIKPMAQTVYDAVGNAVQSTELRGNRTNCTVYDYANRFAVATVTNAAASEVAYTSFEADGANSRWQLGQNTVLTEACPTGNNCLQLFYYPVSTTVAINKDYILSFWATTPTVAVNGVTAPALTGPSINGWTYYEYRLPTGTASPVLTNNVNTGCKIDELRLYPVGAAMGTTTYAPGIGKTGVCDANNRIAYFTYDGLGRPDKEKDAYGNVVKTYEYRFKE